MHEVEEPRRALVLAGGGLKVAFQAGVLQVWLDEARDAAGRPLSFHHADGASGGVFNLAMWCQGLSGRQIADNWRRTSPLKGLSTNWRPWQSLLTYDRFRRTTLDEEWQLDWDRIRSSDRSASFNVFNFTNQELEVRTPAEMDEDVLVAAVSLPMWYPSVRHHRDIYIDAVFATDANLVAAIDAGADELWIIWTVSQRGNWRTGFVHKYFQMIEAIANSRVREVLNRIHRSNDAIQGGGRGEFNRTITVRWLAAEVPAHYLMSFTNASMREAVDRGVAAARTWCREQGFGLVETAEPPAPDPDGLTFRERMAGFFAFGVADPVTGAARGRAAGNELTLRLTVSVHDERRFEQDPDHVATLHGTVESEQLGGVLEVQDGVLRLLTDDGDFIEKTMTYCVHATNDRGDEITVIGRKEVRHDAAFDLWPDTTTLYVRIFRGHYAELPEDDDNLVGSGVLRISALSFLHQLTTFRAHAGGPARRTRTLTRFGTFFVRNLWQVYGRPVDRTAVRNRPLDRRRTGQLDHAATEPIQT
jgi:predicted patatin/cPLA2 family phospholipase